MSVKSVRPRRWHLSAGIIIPVILSLLVMAGGVGAFVLWSTTNSDTRSLQRETQLLKHFINEELVVMPLTQEAMVVRDDAAEATGEDFDEDWIDENLGLSVWEQYGYEQAVVYDGNDTPIYMMSDGEEADPELFADDQKVFAPMIARLRADLAAGGVRNYLGGASDNLPSAIDIAKVSGSPAMISVVPIISESGEFAPGPGKEALHLVVDFLDKDFADYVADQNLLDYGIFRTGPSKSADGAAIPMMSSAGRIVAFFEWPPDRPGRRLLTETVPAMVGALLVAAILIALLLMRIARYAAQVETGRLEAQHRAFHDVLTGLPNRACFEDCLSRSATEWSSPPPVLMLLDLDRFKQVNDTLGHPAGDDLIRQVGQRLSALLGSDGTIARLGGDEFAILANALNGPEAAMAFAARIVETVGKPFDLSGHEASVGVSIGVVIARGGFDRAELIRKADIALYEAKAAGRNRAVVYEDRMDTRVQQRHAIEAELREALRRPDQLSVAFEPMVSATGRIVGAEALPVWKHPRQGDIPARRLIAIAESAALIEPLGELMLRQACELGTRCPGQIVSVNVVHSQLKNPKFFTRTFDILADYGMPPASLELEIDEAILLKDQEATIAVLRKLSAAGIRIAIDEFGTGQASLNFLRQCHVDRIKIARVEPARPNDTRVALAIVQATMTLAHAMDIEVAAAGIETQERVSQLTAMGCTLFQGPFFYAAMSIDAVEARLNRQQPTATRQNSAIVTSAA